jgi:hypothetical protein
VHQKCVLKCVFTWVTKLTYCSISNQQNKSTLMYSLVCDSFETRTWSWVFFESQESACVDRRIWKIKADTGVPKPRNSNSKKLETTQDQRFLDDFLPEPMFAYLSLSLSLSLSYAQEQTQPDKPLAPTSQDQYWQDFHLHTSGFESHNLFEAPRVPDAGCTTEPTPLGLIVGFLLSKKLHISCNQCCLVQLWFRLWTSGLLTLN